MWSPPRRSPRLPPVQSLRASLHLDRSGQCDADRQHIGVHREPVGDQPARDGPCQTGSGSIKIIDQRLAQLNSELVLAQAALAAAAAH